MDTELSLVLNKIRQRLDGYAACTDAPMCGLVREIMEVYPEAKVICTIRDPDSWVKSMAGVSDASTMWFLRAVLLPLPGMRHFVDYINVLRKQWIYLYGEQEPVTRKSYDRHVEWLKEIVPEDRLVFFDVKEGWGSLCKALGKEVPAGVAFPRINDGEAIDRFAKAIVKRGLIRWLVILSMLGLAIISIRYVL